MNSLSPTWAIIMAAASPPPAPPPAPHARVKPKLTLAMLEALKMADTAPDLCIEAPAGTRRALIYRGLARRVRIDAKKTRTEISSEGSLLIRTQYDALKKVLTGTV
jgi:hypothetical protein